MRELLCGRKFPCGLAEFDARLGLSFGDRRSGLGAAGGEAALALDGVRGESTARLRSVGWLGDGGAWLCSSDERGDRAVCPRPVGWRGDGAAWLLSREDFWGGGTSLRRDSSPMGGARSPTSGGGSGISAVGLARSLELFHRTRLLRTTPRSACGARGALTDFDHGEGPRAYSPVTSGLLDGPGARRGAIDWGERPLEMLEARGSAAGDA